MAQALTLECKVPATNGGGGYVTELYIFEVNEENGEAIVADGWIMHVHDAPIPAKISDNSKKKLALTWNLVISNNSGQQTKMQYRAAYYKDTKEVVVRAVPGGGYGGTFEGRGKCKTL
jgi:hypothetical protein